MVRLLIGLRGAIRGHTAARLGGGWLTAAALLALASAGETLVLAGHSYHLAGAGADVTAFVLALWFAGRILASAVAGGTAELQPALLALLPVSARRLAWSQLVAELLDPGTLLLAIALAGTAVLGFRSGFASGVVGLAAALLTTVLCTVLAVAAGGLLGPASRRGRDRGTLLTAIGLSVVASAGALLPLLKTTLDDRSSPVSHVLRGLPSGWGPAAVAAAARSDWSLVVFSLAGLAVATVVAAFWWPTVLRRRMAGGSPRTHVVRRTRLGFLPATPYGAVMAKELRLWLRDPLRFTCLAVAALVGIGVCVLPAAISGSTVLLPFTGVLTSLIAAACACNLYGFDGTSLWLTVLTPGGRTPEVSGRQLAWLLVVAPYSLVATVVATAVSGQGWAWPWVLSALFILLGEGAGLLSWGLLISVQPLDPSGGPTPAWSLKVQLSLLFLSVGALPGLAPLVAGQLLGSVSLRWVGVPLALVISLGLAVFSGRRAALRLEYREVAVLATLSAASR